MLRSSFLRGSYQCHWLVPIHIAFINLVSARLIFPQISHLKMSLAHAEHKLISSWDLLDVSLSILMFSAVSCMNFNLQVSFMHRKMCNYYVPIIIIYYKKKCYGWSVLGFLISPRIIQNLCLHKLLFFYDVLRIFSDVLTSGQRSVENMWLGAFSSKEKGEKKLTVG